ncbi:MAG: enoyl-CoA hydratase/isomerase family protein [Rhodospirillaceae bacterium]|jgi:enoyl-CoA hydratase|nr:enoyl-CoA hydratase/isomerase family protein [Rhodospirillaceae bacterium]MDD9915694.1 enoyl-CoA hydratase/isomerase family protein [Rhodospirillaceae bacterium]MDD9927142.1 enoyl-CoA hydratase/isomerase family protein [Rhodospirillaceae bacterium]
MTYETITYEKNGPVATVTLNRPDKLNALSDELQLEVRSALEDAGWEDDAIRVIVLKAAGRAFSAGFDITTSAKTNAAAKRARFLKGKNFSASGWWDVFWNNPKPIIAQIQGFCIAGGLATATFCDLRICSEDSKFGAPEIRTGGPYIPAVWPWVIGMTKAREMLYTGNLIDAEEAKRLNLVNEVVPADELDEAVNRQAQTIAKLPAATVEYNKKLINMSYELMGVRQVVERSMELEAIALASADTQPEIEEFNKIRNADGLKAALSWNAERFSEEDAWFKKSRDRG